MKLTSRQTKDILGGLTTFLAMSYLLFLYPLMASTPGTGVPASAALTGAVCLTIVMTLCSAFFTKLPYVLAPGMGTTVFVVFSVVVSQKIPWPTAMGIVLLSGILFLIVSLTPIRRVLMDILPVSLKHGIIAGIGSFLMFIGIKNLGVITQSKNTLIDLSPISTSSALGTLGFLVAFFFHYKKKPYAFIASVVVVTLCSVFLGSTKFPTHFFELPDFSLFFHIDVVSALQFSFLSIIFSLLITNVFDSTSCILAIAQTGNFFDKKGEPVNLKQSLIVDSIASIVAACFGSTPGAIYLESTAGVEMGARTGLASVVTALCFVPCLFFAPLFSSIPTYAVAPVLIFLGMTITFFSLKKIDVSRLEDAVPVFFTVLYMPLSSSITMGVIAGILSHLVIKILQGKAKKITWSLYFLGIFCLIALLIPHIQIF